MRRQSVPLGKAARATRRVSSGTVGGSCGRRDMSVSLREGGAASSLLHHILHRHNGRSGHSTEFATSITIAVGPQRAAGRGGEGPSRAAVVRASGHRAWLEPKCPRPPDRERAIPPARQGVHELRPHPALPAVGTCPAADQGPLQLRLPGARPRGVGAPARTRAAGAHPCPDP